MQGYQEKVQETYYIDNYHKVTSEVAYSSR